MSDVSVVIGCSSEIGRAICDGLIARGDLVIGTARSGKLSDENSISGNIEIEACDSTSIESIRSLFERIARYRPRHLFYCAGYHRLAPVSPASSGSLANHLAVNFQGAVDCSRFFINNKTSRTDLQRTITVVASIAHRIGEAGLVGYSASKAAVVAAVRGMAIEYASRNIRVNSVSPGWIEGVRADAVATTISAEALAEIRSRYPLGFGRPVDVASAAMFLASDQARWITGVDLIVDGGRSST
jgi:NAD(P)-dependent dehydrogenase (short-subunit alcohol dehydrogenase family)